MAKTRKIVYEPHPVSVERKRELIDQGYKILDARFAPVGHLREDGPTVGEFVAAGYLAANYPPVGYRSRSTDDEIAAAVAAQADAAKQAGGNVSTAQPESASVAPENDGLDDLEAGQLHALAKDRGVSVHHKAGADKVREALREAAKAEG